MFFADEKLQTEDSNYYQYNYRQSPNIQAEPLPYPNQDHLTHQQDVNQEPLTHQQDVNQNSQYINKIVQQYTSNNQQEHEEEVQYQNKLVNPEPINPGITYANTEPVLSEPQPFTKVVEKTPEATNYGGFYPELTPLIGNGYSNQEYFDHNHLFGESLGGEITPNFLDHNIPTSEINHGAYMIHGGSFDTKLPQKSSKYPEKYSHAFGDGGSVGYYYYDQSKNNKYSKKDDGIFGAFGKKVSKFINHIFGVDKHESKHHGDNKYKDLHGKKYEDSLFGALTENKPTQNADSWKKQGYGFGHG